MMRTVIIAAVAIGVLSVASVSPAQTTAEDGVPDQPFQTVHLMAVEPSQQAGVKTDVDDFNSEFARQGCPACAYHLSRRVVGSQSPFNAMLVANWPSRAVYVRIHGSAGYQTVQTRNPIFETLEATQFYGRFVELK